MSGENQSNKRTQEEFNYEDSGETVGKKAKIEDGSGAISKTLHVRSLPQDATEQDLILLASPFGTVTNVLMLKGKNQALIQMQDIQCTAALLQYYNTARAAIRGRPVYFQYSNRDEIASLQPPMNKQEQQNHILLVTVLNLQYNVDINVLHQVFSKYGTILKIVIFTKSAGFQALIQYMDVNSAVEAKNELDGQNIYSGCNTLRIQFSALANLNVKYNNEKSRDFTNPNLPTTPAEVVHPAAIPMMDYNPYAYPAPAQMKAMPPMNQMVIPGMAGQGPVVIVSNLNPEKTSPDMLFTLFGVYGDVIRVKILHNKRDTALIQFINPAQAETAVNHLNQTPFLGGVIRVNYSKHATIALPRAGTDQETINLTKDYTGSNQHRYKVFGSRNFQHICPPGPVLHISNMPESTSDETLRELFEAYGTVTGFRFLTKEKKMALIQMSTLAEAVQALVFLHNHSVDGMNIRVSFSKSSINSNPKSST